MCERKIKQKKLKAITYNIEARLSPEGDTIFHPKPKEFAQILYKEIQKIGIKDKIMIQSFDTRFLREFRKLNEEISLVLLVENSLSLRDNIEILGFAPTIYSPHIRLLTQAMVDEAHDLGIKVIPWNFNEIDEFNNIKNM
jgi:glycerophosphoryl diester phosphodiesterase